MIKIFYIFSKNISLKKNLNRAYNSDRDILIERKRSKFTLKLIVDNSNGNWNGVVLTDICTCVHLSEVKLVKTSVRRISLGSKPPFFCR